MNYIIFGGSGFIGTHLIHLLKNECVKPGDKIYDLDIVMPGEEGVVPGVVEKNEGVEYIRLDVQISAEKNWQPVGTSSTIHWKKASGIGLKTAIKKNWCKDYRDGRTDKSSANDDRYELRRCGNGSYELLPTH